MYASVSFARMHAMSPRALQNDMQVQRIDNSN